MPAEPVKPVSQARRSALFGTYSLVLVGARHHEAVEAAAASLGPELGDVLGALSGRGGVVEKLKLGHGKHHRNRD